MRRYHTDVGRILMIFTRDFCIICSLSRTSEQYQR